MVKRNNLGLIGGLVGAACGVGALVSVVVVLHRDAAQAANHHRTGGDAPAMVELGQFAAPITRVDGRRGVLLIQARIAVSGQEQSLQISRNLPVVRHGVLREIYRMAGRGEADLTVDGTVDALKIAVDSSYGEGVTHQVFIDRMLVQ